MIYSVIPKVAKAIGAIGKNRKNQQQGFNFRGIDDVYNACHEPMTEFGLFCTTEVLDVQREERTTAKGGVLFYTMLKLKVTFYCQDGSSVTTVTAGEAMDSGDKATNKAMSAALKYAFFQTFVIPIEQMPDADETTPQEIQPKAKPQTPQHPPGPPMSDEQIEFNAWAKPLIDANRITRDRVREVLKECGGVYGKARALIETELAA